MRTTSPYCFYYSHSLFKFIGIWRNQPSILIYFHKFHIPYLSMFLPDLMPFLLIHKHIANFNTQFNFIRYA
jgi:hypothetical protein